MMAKKKVNFPKYLIYKTPKDKIIKLLKPFSTTIPKLRYRRKYKMRDQTRMIVLSKK